MEWNSTSVRLNDPEPKLIVSTESRASLDGVTFVEILTAGDKVYIDCQHNARVSDKTQTDDNNDNTHPVVMSHFTIMFVAVEKNTTALTITKLPG